MQSEDGVRVERVARAICGATGCQESVPSVHCRNGCGGRVKIVLEEYGDAAHAAIAALSPDHIADAGKMIDRIGALLSADPVCMGRVCSETVEAIAALMRK